MTDKQTEGNAGTPHWNSLHIEQLYRTQTDRQQIGRQSERLGDTSGTVSRQNRQTENQYAGRPNRQKDRQADRLLADKRGHAGRHRWKGPETADECKMGTYL